MYSAVHIVKTERERAACAFEKALESSKRASGKGEGGASVTCCAIRFFLGKEIAARSPLRRRAYCGFSGTGERCSPSILSILSGVRGPFSMNFQMLLKIVQL